MAAAQALLKIVEADDPPSRVLVGHSPYPMIRQAYADRPKAWTEWLDLSATAWHPPKQGNSSPA
jgi:hypothetical protein